ncbi:MAG: hypothetical protein WCB96_09335 [Candidatus Aminicenantales bacterium]
MSDKNLLDPKNNDLIPRDDPDDLDDDTKKLMKSNLFPRDDPDDLDDDTKKLMKSDLFPYDFPRHDFSRPIITMSLEEMADALASTEAYPSDLGDGLKLNRGPLGDGLHIFKKAEVNGLGEAWHIVRDLFTLTTEELEKVRKFLESGGNDLIPSE